MLPIADNNMWSRLTDRIHFRVREGIASTTILDDGAHALGSWNGASEEGPFTDHVEGRHRGLPRIAIGSGFGSIRPGARGHGTAVVE